MSGCCYALTLGVDPPRFNDRPARVGVGPTDSARSAVLSADASQRVIGRVGAETSYSEAPAVAGAARSAVRTAILSDVC